MIQRLARLRGMPVFGALFTLIAKAGGSAAALVMFALAARVVDVTAFGHLVVAFNLVSFAAVVAVFGQDMHMQRAWGEYAADDPGAAAGILRFGLAAAVLGATVVAALWVVWSLAVDDGLSDAALLAATAFLVTQTLLHFVGGLARVVCGSARSEPPRELFWRLPLVAALAVATVGGGTADLAGFFTVAAVGQLVTVVWLARAVHRHLPDAVRHARPVWHLAVWTRRSLAITGAALTEAAHQYADVVLVGFLVGPDAAAGYFVILRIANVFPMLTSGIHTYSASKIAALHYAGRDDDLRRLMAQVMALALVLVLVAWTLIAVAGGSLLALFGEEYRVWWPELVAMCLVTGTATLAGPAPLLMQAMGAELLYLQLVIGALAARLATLVLLVPFWGVDGAVAAAMIVLVPFVVGLAVVCTRRLGIDPSIGAVVRAYCGTSTSPVH